MKQYSKKFLYLLGGVFLLWQFFRPTRNLSGDSTQNIAHTFPTSDSVKNILKAACYDCHSNKTVYPWYAEVQPVASWLAHHVEEGKHELNFDVFGGYKPRRQYHKMEEVIEQIEHGEMPLASYTWMHADARLNPQQKQLLIQWANGVMDALKAQYPMDSLVVKKKK